MARIRNPLSWGRKRAVPEDASFFDAAGVWRPRPDSPELSVFTPEEEAESHARWRRAVRLSSRPSEARRSSVSVAADQSPSAVCASSTASFAQVTLGASREASAA